MATAKIPYNETLVGTVVQLQLCNTPIHCVKLGFFLIGKNKPRVISLKRDTASVCVFILNHKSPLVFTRMLIYSAVYLEVSKTKIEDTRTGKCSTRVSKSAALMEL